MALFIAASIFFVALDRFLKMLALNLGSSQKTQLAGDLLTFNFSKNYQIAFSLPLSGIILEIIIAMIILGLMAVCLKNYRNKKLRIGIALTFLLFGAISNFADRMYYGYVIDYFDLKHFTVFNLADMMIIAGTLALILVSKQYNEFRSSS